MQLMKVWISSHHALKSGGIEFQYPEAENNASKRQQLVGLNLSDGLDE